MLPSSFLCCTWSVCYIMCALRFTYVPPFRFPTYYFLCSWCCTCSACYITCVLRFTYVVHMFRRPMVHKSLYDFGFVFDASWSLDHVHAGLLFCSFFQGYTAHKTLQHRLTSATSRCRVVSLRMWCLRASHRDCNRGIGLGTAGNVVYKFANRICISTHVVTSQG